MYDGVEGYLDPDRDSTCQTDEGEGDCQETLKRRPVLQRDVPQSSPMSKSHVRGFGLSGSKFRSR